MRNLRAVEESGRSGGGGRKLYRKSKHTDCGAPSDIHIRKAGGKKYLVYFNGKNNYNFDCADSDRYALSFYVCLFAIKE